VNGEKLVPLLDRIRENLPVEIQNAQRLLERRDEIINEAQAKANHVLQEAKRQSEFMLSESELLRAVQDEAGRIRQQITLELEAMQKKAFEESEARRAQAMEEAAIIRAGADQYAEAILGSLDKSLGEFQVVVRNGQRYLKKARMDAAQQAPVALRGAYATPPAAYGADYPTGGGHPPGERRSAVERQAEEMLRQTTLTR
jgi:cell division septum initiation protein DivIVA